MRIPLQAQPYLLADFMASPYKERPIRKQHNPNIEDKIITI